MISSGAERRTDGSQLKISGAKQSLAPVLLIRNNQNLDFVIINDEIINKICERNNYADKLYRRIKCIELNDFNANEIITCFDTRIMPIL